MQRSLLRFDNALKTEATKQTYRYNLDRFLKYCKIKDHDSLLQLKEQALQEILEDYLFSLKKTVSPNTIPSLFYPLEVFFSMNDKVINWKKLKRMYPAKVKKSGKEAWSNEDVKKMLDVCHTRKKKALIHFLASTGCRIGAIPELKLKHISDIENCKAIQFYDDTNDEYWGFLTPEASKVLDEYLKERENDGEILRPEHPLFRKSYSIGGAKAVTTNMIALKIMVLKIIQEANLDRVKVGKRYNIQMDHGFRKRFNTILKLNKEINPNIIEKLMGHKNGLDGVYLSPTRDQCFAEFKKGITDLTVDDKQRLLVENQQKQEKIKELENMKDKRMYDLERTVKKFAKEIRDLRRNTPKTS